MFENVYGRTHGRTDGRTPDRPVYYKLTLSGDLINSILKNRKFRSHPAGAVLCVFVEPGNVVP